MEDMENQKAEKNEIMTAGGSLLEMAISNNIDTDKLEKLIDLKNREEERLCKKLFDEKFAEMQRTFEPVKRAKQGYGYNYAPLELLQKQYGKSIAEYGFSYRWREEALDGGGKRVVLVISGYGHTDDSTSFDIPQMEPVKNKNGSNVQNAAQVLGSMSTYGKRYTFMAGFGIIVEDEDDDAASLTYEDGIQYAEDVKRIRSAKAVDELRTLWKEIYSDKLTREHKEILVLERDKKLKDWK